MDINVIKEKNIRDLTYNEIKFLFIDNNMSYVNIAHLFNLKSNTPVRNLIKKYNIVKSKELIAKCCIASRQENYEQNHEAHIARYIESHGMLPEEYRKKRQTEHRNEKYSSNDLSFKEKCQETWTKKSKTEIANITSKRKNTSREKYGCDSPTQTSEVQNKMKQTMIERYGVANYAQTKKGRLISSKTGSSEEVKQKRKQTNLQKYGANAPFGNKDVQEKIKQTMLAKYGVENPSELKHNNLKHKEFMTNKLTFINLNSDYSLYETDIITFLNSLGITNIERNNRTVLDGKEIDIYIPEYKLGIEFNGNYWHSELKKEQTYHQKKSLLAEQKGIFIYNIFEYEWNDDALKEKIRGLSPWINIQ